MGFMTGIVVGVDGSESAGRALAWAAGEAKLHDWPLTAVLAWGLLDQHRSDPGADFDPHYSDSDALDALDAYVNAAVGPTAETVERHVACDLPARALLQASAGASLLVVADRGLGGFRGLLLGSVSQHCLHYATCPVAVVRNDETRESDSDSDAVVIGVDGSDASNKALDWAAEEAKVRGNSLRIVHAWHVPFAAAYPYGGSSFDLALLEDAAGGTLKAAVERVGATALTHPVQSVLEVGGAASVLLEQAKTADLVVLGSRGRGGFADLVLGSVSHSVAHHAQCPVVVVP